MQRTDPRKTAEAFIEKVIVPARTVGRPDASQQAARAKLAAENRKLAHGELAAGGLDPKRLDKLAAERAKPRLKLAEDARNQAVRNSAAAANRLKGLLPDLPPIEPAQIIVDTVTFIRSFADQGVVVESNIAPSENWARYRLDSTSDSWTGTGRLSFFTLWENQLPVPANMSAQANLSINAYLTCNGDWSGVAAWFGMSSVAGAKVHVQTTVWGMDSSVSSIVEQQDVISAGVDGGFFGGDDNKPVEFAQLLPATAVVVPANTFVLIEVEVLTDWSANSDASVSLDAESGSHRVDLPSLVLTVTPTEPLPPPISLMVTVSYSTSPATVTLNWSGATTASVDLYRNGVLVGTLPNNGSRSTATNPGTYTYHVCEAGSTTVCSNQVTVTVAQ
ncbi:MAG TPA: hypothetical protein VN713_10060 [Sphingomicrobium sp.]|nr:hypothetical protein [Sphingomicrobium sp.]